MCCVTGSFKKGLTNNFRFYSIIASIIIAFFDQRPLASSWCCIEDTFFEHNFTGFPIKIDTFFLFSFWIFCDVCIVALGDILHKAFLQLIFFNFVDVFLAFHTHCSICTWHRTKFTEKLHFSQEKTHFHFFSALCNFQLTSTKLGIN